MGSGVSQFLKEQTPDTLKLKSTSAMLESLPLYGCEEFFAPAGDIEAMGFTANDFVIPVKLIANHDIPSLIDNSDVVLSY